MVNIYYSPEKFGLTLVADIDVREPYYDFDKIVVWKRGHPRGDEFYTAHDSGCSCPSPFEAIGFDDLSGPYTKAAVIKVLEDYIKNPPDYLYPDSAFAQNVVDAISRIINDH